MTRRRLLAGTFCAIVAVSFAVGLLRGENSSVRIPSKDEWRLKTFAEWPREPTSLADFLGVGSHLGVPRTVAIVRIGPVLGRLPAQRAPEVGSTPAPILRGSSTDYEIRIEETLSPTGLRPRETATLRVSGEPSPDYFTPFPHPVEGQRLLLVLVPDHFEADKGVFGSYPYGTANITGPSAHLADSWRTSVTVMGAPATTPAFIEAVRSALR